MAEQQEFADAFHLEMAAFVEMKIRAQHAAVERACEAALQMGDRGVLVIYRGAELEIAQPSQLVPYGQLYEGHL